MSEIYAKINAIMREIPAIGKEKKNMQQGFAYRGIDDVMNALFPLLSKHGVFVVPEVLSTNRSERTTKSGGNMAFTVSTVKYTFYATDGSCVCAVTTGEGMDSADKSTNKAMAAAMKYALFQTFCIPTEECANDDPDRETPEASIPGATAGRQPAQPSALVCADCHAPIVATLINGKKYTAEQVAKASTRDYGEALCYHCKMQRARTDHPGAQPDYDPRAEQEIP